MKVSKGMLLAITTGSYSDYCLRGHMIALRDFDTVEEAERFKRESDEYLNKDWLAKAPQLRYGEDSARRMAAIGSEQRFLAWAIREGLIEEAPQSMVCELYIGGNRLEIE